VTRREPWARKNGRAGGSLVSLLERGVAGGGGLDDGFLG
jgi:hypothetical protein